MKAFWTRLSYADISTKNTMSEAHPLNQAGLSPEAYCVSDGDDRFRQGEIVEKATGKMTDLIGIN